MTTTVSIANIAYNIQNAAVCAVTKVGLSGGTYSGTPVQVQIGKGTQVDPEAVALDPLTSYGRTVALATVLMHANFTLSMGGFDFNAVQIVGNYIVQGYTSPDIYYNIYPTAGGAGLDYFGLIMDGAVADSGANVLIGLPMSKLDTMPSISLNENDWTMSEIGGKSMANASSHWSTAPYIIRPNNSQTNITLTADFFNTFFQTS